MAHAGARTRRDFFVHLSGGLGGLLGLWFAGCQSSAPPPKVTTPSPSHEPLALEPLHGLAIGAGLRWIVLAKPQDLARHPALANGVARLAPPSRRSVFLQLTGIDLDAIQQLVVADYDRSVLFLMDGIKDPLASEEAFRDRLVRDMTRTAYRPDAIWTHGKTAAGDVRAFAAMPPNVVAVEGGDTFRSKVALLLALGRLRRSPRAFDLPDMKTLLDELGDGAVQALAPGPFLGEWENALGGLLRVTSVFGARVRVAEDGAMDLAVRLAGSWGDDPVRASTILLERWFEVARSPVGRLLHLDKPLVEPSVFDRDDMIALDVRLDGARLVDGLHDAVAADLGDVLDLGDATR